jgi:sulfur carrier protein ThiS
MKIKLKPLGIIRQYVKNGEIDIEPHTTCRELIDSLAIPKPLTMVAFINGSSVGLETSLTEPCEVTLVTLVRGG